MSESTDVAKRSVIRRAITIPCVATLEDGLRLFGQRAFDVSTDGVLVEARVPVQRHSRVMLTLVLPGTHRLQARGRVVRVVSNRRPGDPGCAVAVQFDALPQADAERLAQALRGIPPTIPQRALRDRTAGQRTEHEATRPAGAEQAA